MPRLQQGDTKDLIRVGDIVILRWQDIIGHDSAWISREEVKEMKPLEMTSVGRVVSKTRHHITIAGTWSTDDPDTWGNCNCIPTGVVLEIRKVESCQKRRKKK
jgi:hypothetical protein